MSIVKTLGKLKTFFMQNIAEILIVLAIIFLITPTFLLSFIAGLYVTGVIFLLIGVFIAKFR